MGEAFTTGGDFMARPDTSEFNPYFELYIGKVPDGEIVETLSIQLDEFVTFLDGVGEDKSAFRYEPKKWSIKEVVGHIIDCERIFGARALAIARRDQTPLPSFDQDVYVAEGKFDDRTLEDLIGEFEHLRRSHLSLFSSFGEDVWLQRGNAGDNEVSVGAIAWIVAGHLIHHVGVVKECYLQARD
jgi:hypothetical protein